jgi:hypothetical protein
MLGMVCEAVPVEAPGMGEALVSETRCDIRLSAITGEFAGVDEGVD